MIAWNCFKVAVEGTSTRRQTSGSVPWRLIFTRTIGLSSREGRFDGVVGVIREDRGRLDGSRGLFNSLWPSLRFFLDDRLCREAQAERLEDTHDGGEFGVAGFLQRAIKVLARHAGAARDTGHSLGARDGPQCVRDVRRIGRS